MGQDIKALDKIQGRRMMVRVDLPDQNIEHWTDEKVRELVDRMLGKWAFIGQLELGGKSQRLHVQAYVESPNGGTMRVGALVRAIRAVVDSDGVTVSEYVQRAKTTPARCVAYVTKTETRVFGPWSNRPLDSWPKPEDAPQKVTRSDLYAAVMDDRMNLSDIMDDSDMALAASSCLRWLSSLIRQRDAKRWGNDSSFRDVQVLYIYGPSATGKSTVARQYLEREVGAHNFFVVSDLTRDPWGSYGCQRGVLFDDLRLPTPQIGLQDFLRLTDRYPIELSRRYANSWAAFDRIVITSNWAPDKQWEALRWGVSLSAQPTEEDRIAFFRRLTRILQVAEDGVITDQTATYHKDVETRKHASLSQMLDVLSVPVSDQPPTIAGHPIISERHIDGPEDVIALFDLK